MSSQIINYMTNLQKYIDTQANQNLVINSSTNEITKSIDSNTTWNSLTSAYTFAGSGDPYGAGSDIATKKPNYLKPQWLYPLANGNIQVDTSAVNGFTASNLGVINANCEMGALPMVKGDYWDGSKTVTSWVDSIDTAAKRQTQATFLKNFVTTNDLFGIEIDYELTDISTKRADGVTSITQTDIDNKYAFLKLLVTEFATIPKKVVGTKSYSRKVSTAVQPMNVAIHNGTYQLIDYIGLVNTGVDYILVMNYDWWYPTYLTGTSPMSEYLETCQWAVETIPKDKLVMGIPDYGYVGAYNEPLNYANIIRYNQAKVLPGFSTGVINTKTRTILGNTFRGGGELWFASGSNVVNIPNNTTFNIKRQICENFGIKQVSVWSLSGTATNLTPWFDAKIEPKYKEILTK